MEDPNLTNNEIIDETQATQEEFQNTRTRNATGI